MNPRVKTDRCRQSRNDRRMARRKASRPPHHHFKKYGQAADFVRQQSDDRFQKLRTKPAADARQKNGIG